MKLFKSKIFSKNKLLKFNTNLLKYSAFKYQQIGSQSIQIKNFSQEKNLMKPESLHKPSNKISTINRQGYRMGFFKTKCIFLKNSHQSELVLGNQHIRQIRTGTVVKIGVVVVVLWIISPIIFFGIKIFFFLLLLGGGYFGYRMFRNRNRGLANHSDPKFIKKKMKEEFDKLNTKDFNGVDSMINLVVPFIKNVMGLMMSIFKEISPKMSNAKERSMQLLQKNHNIINRNLGNVHIASDLSYYEDNNTVFTSFKLHRDNGTAAGTIDIVLNKQSNKIQSAKIITVQGNEIDLNSYDDGTLDAEFEEKK